MSLRWRSSHEQCHRLVRLHLPWHIPEKPSGTCIQEHSEIRHGLLGLQALQMNVSCKPCPRHRSKTLCHAFHVGQRCAGMFIEKKCKTLMAMRTLAAERKASGDEADQRGLMKLDAVDDAIRHALSLQPALTPRTASRFPSAIRLQISIATGHRILVGLAGKKVPCARQKNPSMPQSSSKTHDTHAGQVWRDLCGNAGWRPV